MFRKGFSKVEERRKIDRVSYPANCIVVVCETGETLQGMTANVSPLGMGIKMPPKSPNIDGKDVIVVAETLIMYADVNRQVKMDDGSFEIGVAARKFTPEVLEYLFDSIGGKEITEA